MNYWRTKIIHDTLLPMAMREICPVCYSLIMYTHSPIPINFYSEISCWRNVKDNGDKKHTPKLSISQIISINFFVDIV